GEVALLEGRAHTRVLRGRDVTAADEQLGSATDAAVERPDAGLPGARRRQGFEPDLAGTGRDGPVGARGVLGVGGPVGVVEDGPADLVGRRVFCLHPHQDRYVVDASMLTPLPDAVPSRRAVLTGTVETALNALWDAPPCAGDRIAVVGGGLVGGAVALLLRRFPLARLQIVDPDAARRRQLAETGLDAVAPEDAAGDCDLVFHASASESGLAAALALLGDEAELVEMSWFGAREPRVPLGEDFHSRRLRITASQVSRIGAARRARRDPAARLATALEFLADPAFDTLIAADVAFDEMDDAYAALEDGRIGPGCVVVAYPDSP
ncbi:MAG: zinc-binding alcohol dehydrogenase, partial [Microbacterium chocolatum]|nr:zinc-binding alcohol dehydrogenase [Microbacterium chocolatum]